MTAMVKQGQRLPSEPPHWWMVNEDTVRIRAYELWLQNPSSRAEDNWRTAVGEFRAANGWRFPSIRRRLPSTETRRWMAQLVE